MVKAQKKSFADLHIFLGIVASLILIGFIFVYSSSSVYGLEKFGSSQYFVKKQFFGLLLGLAGLFILRILPIRFIKFLIPVTFLTTLALTAMTKISHFSVRIHGSSRWLKLFGFTFQPSEMLKFALILYVAYFIAKKQNVISSFFQTYLPLLFVIGLTSLVLLSQPDFGLTVTICCTIFILLYIAQFPSQYLITTLVCLIPVAMTLIYLKPYRFKRVLTFLNPWADPKGSGFQIIQSLIAIGSGSFWGVGVSHSRQKFFYLPMQHTDFIFSIIAEETGFLGSLCLVFLFIAFAYFGVRVALKLHDPFGMFAVLGFVILTSLQAITNLAVTTGLVPTKGVGLPFVSYGSTSLVCSLAMIGLIINLVYSEKSRE